MELQQSSTRRVRRSSRRPVRPAIGWTPLELARLGSVGLIVAGPWYFAGAPWLAQYWMIWASLVLVALMACEILRRLWLKQETRKLSIPAPAVLLLCLASYGWIQAIPMFSMETQGGWAPSSVELQRWFLGVPNEKLDARFNATANRTLIPESSPTETWLHDARIAVSVEPLHSRAAVGGIAMAAVMIWIGATAFLTRRSQLALMITMTLLGVLFGLLGLAHVLSWEKVNWLGLHSSTSFATFVSRNTAGGFMNLCLAGSIGLAAWAFSQPRKREQGYSYGSESPALRILHTFEDLFSQLTTAQICALLSTAIILIGVFCTGSRGATISAVIACLFALLFTRSKKNQVGVWVFAILVMLIGMSGIYFFELDDRITSRFSELTTADALENQIEVGRLYIWSIAMKAFLFFGFFGSGLGTFHYAHLPFQDPTGWGWYYHAENFYLQILVELGWIGAIAIVLMFSLSIRTLLKLAKAPQAVDTRGRQSVDLTPSIFLVGLTVIISQAVHSAFDFALIVPAVFLPASLIFGMIYGVAKDRNVQPPVDEEGQSGETAYRIRNQRLPKVEGPRFANLIEPPVPLSPVSVSPKPARRYETAMASIACLGLLLLLSSSLRPVEAMFRVDKMNRWLQEQSKVARSSRIGSPSAYLAGLWGRPSISIYQAPEALRILGESVLYEFRSQLLDQMKDVPGENASVSWERTSPLMVRLAIAEKEAEARAKGENQESFDKSAVFASIMGGSEQIARWEKARELIERAHLQSPLDWRLAWGRLLLDRKLDVSQWNGWFDRSGFLSRHRPDTLFQIGVLGWQAAKDREHVYSLWHKAMRLAPWLAPSAASIIAMETPDDEVPSDIFPAQPYYLSEMAKKPFDSSRFPKTNERLWRRVGETALELGPTDPNRYAWLASTAAHFGETEKELEYLGESVNHAPLNKQLRMQLADRLAATGQLEPAIEQAEICRSLDPDDPQIEASLKRLQALVSEAKHKE